MFCPYVRNGYMRTTLIKYDENENENGSYIAENYTNAECVKEQCGVWYDGKCNYKMEERK